MNRPDNEKGSFTIEISMIFTLIVFVILMLLFTFLYLQQKAGLESAASFAAQQGAELWLDSRRSMEDGRADKTEASDPISYRVFDNLLFAERTYEGYFVDESDGKGGKRKVLKMDSDDGLPGKKVMLIGDAICQRIEGSILKPDSTKVRITYSNNVLRGKLTVEIIQEIKVPLSGLKEFLSGKGTLTLRAQSTAAVAEPSEYIRNVDLAIELSRRFGDKLDFQELLGRVKSKGKK